MFDIAPLPKNPTLPYASSTVLLDLFVNENPIAFPLPITGADVPNGNTDCVGKLNVR